MHLNENTVYVECFPIFLLKISDGNFINVFPTNTFLIKLLLHNNIASTLPPKLQFQPAMM